MRIIEIHALSNGSHRNQTTSMKTIPEGWAVVPDDVPTPNFPFGKIEVKEIDGVMTVTKWEAGTLPEKIPFYDEELETGISEVEQLRADVDYIAVMTGVEL